MNYMFSLKLFAAVTLQDSRNNKSYVIMEIIINSTTVEALIDCQPSSTPILLIALNSIVITQLNFNPLTAGAAYIRVFIFY